MPASLADKIRGEEPLMLAQADKPKTTKLENIIFFISIYLKTALY
jgi:hypothetical protein